MLVALFVQPCCCQTIGLEEFLELVKESHPFFVKEKMSVEIEKKANERFLGSQDWILTSSPVYSYQEPVGTGAFTPETIDAAGIETTFERAFWNTGGRLSLSLSYDYSDQGFRATAADDAPVDPSVLVGPSELYENRAYLTYSHPLLQNSRGNLDRLEYDISNYTVDITELQSLENQEEFLLDLASRFLEWVLLSEQKRIADERLGLAEEELEQTQRKRDANLVDEVDVLRAKDAVLIAERNVVLVGSYWKSKQAELAVLAQSPEVYDLHPEFDLYSQQTMPSADEAVSELGERSRILEAFAVRKDLLFRQLEGLIDTKRPQLAFNVGAGLQSGDEEFADSLDFDQPDAFVSLLFRYPLGNRTATSDVEKAELEILRIQEETKSAQLDLEAAARNLLIQIGELEKVLALNKEQIESARKKTEEELKLYNQGRGQLTFVIQSRDNERNAKLVNAQNATSYHNLILQYRALTDELLKSDSE
jgi:outer membrane protein TolC